MADTSTDLTRTPITADLLRGVVELETTDRGVRPHRLPAWARAQCPDPQLLMAEAQPAGVRVVVRTAASVVELETVPTKRVYAGLPPRPDGRYDLLVDGEPAGQGTADGGDVLTIDMVAGSVTTERGPSGSVRFEGLPSHDKTVEVWLPHDEATELVSLRTDAPVAAVPTGDRPVWVHHGSSISHGSNAASPTTTWPALVAREAGLDLVNLGFGGGALLDPFTARVLRDTPADVISVKIGINVVNADLLRLRALGPAVHGFLDTIREGHPDTPLLVVTPLLCPVHEDTPGPLAPDLEAMRRGEVSFVATGDPTDVATGRLTLRTVRAELERVVAQRREGDPHLHLLDGLALYGPDDAETHPLPDNVHPDPATHRLLAERFTALALGPDGPFAAVRHG